MVSELHLQTLSEGEASSSFCFSSRELKTVKIGRLRSANVWLNDRTIARVHAVIEFRGDKSILLDMGGRSGTRKNGEKVQQCELYHGDIIQLGASQLRVGLGEPFHEAGTEGRGEDKVWEFPFEPIFGGGGSVLPRVLNESSAPISKESLVAYRRSEEGNELGLEQQSYREMKSYMLEIRCFVGKELLGVEHYVAPKAITIGETKKSTFFLSSDGLPSKGFPIIRCINDQYVLTFTEKMQGELEQDGHICQLNSIIQSSLVTPDSVMKGSYRIALSLKSRGLIHWGGLSFSMRFVSRHAPSSTSWSSDVDSYYFSIVLLSFLFHFGLVAVLLSNPTSVGKYKPNVLEDAHDRFVKIILSPITTPNTNSNPVQANATAKGVLANRELNPRNKELELRNKLVPPHNFRPEGGKDLKEKIRQLFREVNSTLEGGQENELINNKGFSKEVEELEQNTLELESEDLGLRRDIFVVDASPIRSVFRVSTTGRREGDENAEQYGEPPLIGDSNERRLPALKEPVVTGGLAKEVIKRVIDRNKNQVRYCYEMELQQNRSLAGRVAMRWLIQAAGKVGDVSIRESTMNNERVERCMIRQIKAWVFPQPVGGDVVEVNYAFVFTSS